MAGCCLFRRTFLRAGIKEGFLRGLSFSLNIQTPLDGSTLTSNDKGNENGRAAKSSTSLPITRGGSIFSGHRPSGADRSCASAYYLCKVSISRIAYFCLPIDEAKSAFLTASQEITTLRHFTSQYYVFALY